MDRIEQKFTSTLEKQGLSPKLIQMYLDMDEIYDAIRDEARELFVDEFDPLDAEFGCNCNDPFCPCG